MTVAAELNPSDSDGEEEQSAADGTEDKDTTPQRASKDNTAARTKVCSSHLTGLAMLNSL